jgi:hypothetical protein
LTGVPTAPTAAPFDNTTQLATTAFVTAAVAAAGPSLTPGSIPFAGPGGALTQDNANLFYDDANNRVGIGTATPATALQVKASAAAVFARVTNTGPFAAGIQFTDGGTVYGQVDFNGATNDLNLHADTNIRFYPAFSATPTVVFTLLGHVQIGPSGLTPSRGATVMSMRAAPPAGLSADEAYLSLGGDEFGANSYRALTFGWFTNTSTYQPAFIAYKETSSGGDTHGDLIFGTRPSTTDVQPDEVLRITAAGNVAIGAVAPTARLHLPAGAAGAGLAPLKLEPGTLLATPEIGAVEFTDDGTTGHLYVTVNIAGVPTRVQIV